MPTVETIAIGVVLLFLVIVLWKFLVMFLKLGASLVMLVAVVWGGMMILQYIGVDFSAPNKVSSDVTKKATEQANEVRTYLSK